MNFVKYFDVDIFGGSLSEKMKNLVDRINAFAKENGCEPISVTSVDTLGAVVVFQPI